jgi:hypothetical protein
MVGSLKLLLKITLILFGLILLPDNCQAKKVPGFIINENSDTLIGKIRIYSHNPNIRGFNIYGIDIEPFYSIVRFKGNTDKRFRNYEPEDIKGFCFRYKSMDYFFREFKLEFSTLFGVDHFRSRFLNLIYKGKLALYQDEVRNPILKNFKNFQDYTEVHYNYYLFDELKGLHEVELTKKIRTIKDLLAIYNVDEDFLYEIPASIKPKEIKLILEEYDFWLKQHNSVESGN